MGWGGSSFQYGGGQRVDLGRREPLKSVLITLAEFRLSAPGAPLSYDYVFMTAWPGKLPSSEEVSRRIRGAVCALEALGLWSSTIMLLDDSICLDPLIEVVIEPELVPAETSVPPTNEERAV